MTATDQLLQYASEIAASAQELAERLSDAADEIYEDDPHDQRAVAMKRTAEAADFAAAQLVRVQHELAQDVRLTQVRERAV